MPGCQKLQTTTQHLWHRMLYSFTHMATVGVKELTEIQWQSTESDATPVRQNKRCVYSCFLNVSSSISLIRSVTHRSAGDSKASVAVERSRLWNNHGSSWQITGGVGQCMMTLTMATRKCRTIHSFFHSILASTTRRRSAKRRHQSPLYWTILSHGFSRHL